MAKGAQKELNWKFYKAVRSRNISVAQSLLDLGADINALNDPWWNNDVPPIIEAVGDKYYNTLKWLLQNGANPNIKSGTADRETPLLWAMHIRSEERIIDLLLEYGADPRIMDDKGRSPISKIAGNKKKLGLLQKFQNAVAKIEEKKNKIAPVQEKVPVPASVRAEADNEAVIFNRKMGSVYLEEHFNFVARERLTLVRAEQQGPVQAVTREHFSTIEESVLLDAFNVYKKAGGKIPESEIFDDKIVKLPMPGKNKQS